MSNAAPALSDTAFFGHPRGLLVCFATEMWERFSYYGMRALLVLYLVKHHHFSDTQGFEVLGSYAGLVYAMPVIGGLLADRYLGMRKSVVFGGILLVLGHCGMAVEGVPAREVAGAVVRDEGALQVFYLSLALIVIGVGFLKPNISTIVGRLYGADDPRRDGGFTIFYMGINLGAFCATLLCAYLGEHYGWSWGFGAAGIGMLLGLATFLGGQRHLLGHAEPADPARLRRRSALGLSTETTIYLGGLAAVALAWQMLQFHGGVGALLNTLSVAVLVGLAWYIVTRCDRVQRQRMLALVMLTVSSVVFWALFEQAGSSMTLFADRVMDREIFGLRFTAGQLQFLNPGFIFLFAPVFAWLWTALGRRGLEPRTPVKFALGILQAGVGFGALVLGARYTDATGLVAGYWIVIAYLLHTTGELCLSPVGLSAVTRLSAPAVVGVMMGSWFLATAYSEFTAAQLAKLAAVHTVNGEVADIAVALAGYTALYADLLKLGIGVGLLLLLASPLLRRMMHGVH